MKGKSLLKVELRNYQPSTARADPIERKTKLRNLIERKIGSPEDLMNVRLACRDKPLSVEVKFFLFGDSNEEGRSKKDLDNLLKIVLDVLPEYVVAEGTTPRNTGLGLICDDELIYEIHASKHFVSQPDMEGLNLDISEYIEKLS